MENYHDFIRQYGALIQEARNLPWQPPVPCNRTPRAPDAPCAILFSPHPDDESITGTLPLRLLKECGFRIVNQVITLGSLKSRRAERAKELQMACDYLGFELLLPAEAMPDQVHVTDREDAPDRWRQAVEHLAGLLLRYQPKIIVLPHAADWNSTHIGTHHLIMDTLKAAGSFSCHVVETEFWAAMKTPNLMVEAGDDDLSELCTAVACHRMEVQRNPYHVTLPAWMNDNVRRGAERLGGQGQSVPGFLFATLYRASRWLNSELILCAPPKPMLAASDRPDAFLNG